MRNLRERFLIIASIILCFSVQGSGGSVLGEDDGSGKAVNAKLLEDMMEKFTKHYSRHFKQQVDRLYQEKDPGKIIGEGIEAENDKKVFDRISKQAKTAKIERYWKDDRYHIKYKDIVITTSAKASLENVILINGKEFPVQTNESYSGMLARLDQFITDNIVSKKKSIKSAPKTSFIADRIVASAHADELKDFKVYRELDIDISSEYKDIIYYNATGATIFSFDTPTWVGWHGVGWWKAWREDRVDYVRRFFVAMADDIKGASNECEQNQKYLEKSSYNALGEELEKTLYAMESPNGISSKDLLSALMKKYGTLSQADPVDAEEKNDTQKTWTEPKDGESVCENFIDNIWKKKRDLQAVYGAQDELSGFRGTVCDGLKRLTECLQNLTAQSRENESGRKRYGSSEDRGGSNNFLGDKINTKAK